MKANLDLTQKATASLSLKEVYIKVKDINRSIDFYCNQLGFKILKVLYEQDKLVVHISLTGNSEVQLCLCETPIPDSLSFDAEHNCIHKLNEQLANFNSNATVKSQISFDNHFQDLDGHTLKINFLAHENTEPKEGHRLNHWKYSFEEINREKLLVKTNGEEFDIALKAITLYVKDISVAAKYYGDVLGFREIESKTGTSAEFIVNEKTDTILVIREEIIINNKKLLGSDKFGFEIVPLYSHFYESVFSRILDLGINVTDFDKPFISFEDPDSYVWTLFNPHETI